MTEDEYFAAEQIKHHAQQARPRFAVYAVTVNEDSGQVTRHLMRYVMTYAYALRLATIAEDTFDGCEIDGIGGVDVALAAAYWRAKHGRPALDAADLF